MPQLLTDTMRLAMPTRIDWSPDGTGLVTCLGGAVRLHDVRGEITRELAATNVLDARWLADGRIISLDGRGALVWYRDGVLVEHRDIDFQPPALPPGRSDRIIPIAAYLSASGMQLVAVTEFEVFVATTGGKRTWKFPGLSRRVMSTGVTSAALAANGNLVAIGFHKLLLRQLGRGWTVIDLLDADTWRHYNWLDQPPDERPISFAFDRLGRRLVMTGPEADDGFGAIRVGLGDPVLRTHPGRAAAVALDDAGARAAFVYPDPLPDTHMAVRLDYLSPNHGGPPNVEVLETIWISHELADVVAIAFDRKGRNLACLSSSGEIEVLPVP